jgi:hypothetical protein
MTDWKTALRRHGRIREVFSLVILLASAALAIFILLPSLHPPSTHQVSVPISAPQVSVSWYQGYLFPWITFHTEALTANRTYYGNVTLCCLSRLPTGPGGSTAFNTFDVFVCSEKEYIAMTGKQYGNPLNSVCEVSIREDDLRNYTLNGQAGTEIQSIQFAPRDPSTYYFIVASRNGETQGYLNLEYYKSEIIQNPSLSYAVSTLAILTIINLFLTAIDKYVKIAAPDKNT